VVDCSWNRLSARGGFPDDGRIVAGAGVRRRLPVLVATNPQHYGRLAQLNTAEAFAAALVLVGRSDQAHEILAGFGGGDAFFEVNGSRLADYARAPDAESEQAVERRLFSGDAPD
jgi:pre-rRNA-processing protein TSR3